MDTLVRRRAEADFALCRTRGFQKDELLGRITLHKMTSFLLMMTADSCARRRDSPCNEKVKPQITPKVAAPKVSKGRSESPLVASAEAKSPACGKELLCLKDRQVGRAHLARHSTDVGKSSLEALLRKREVTGRDASLPAPLLTFPLEWSPEKQLGRCPKPHKGRCPLTLQGALPLDPFFASRLERASQRNRYRSDNRPKCLCQENRHPYRPRHIPQSKASHQHRRNLQNLPQR